MQAIMYPSFTSVSNYPTFLYSIIWPRVNNVVKDSIKTKISVKVTVGLTGVFSRTVGIKAIKDTSKADMFSMIFPVRVLSW